MLTAGCFDHVHPLGLDPAAGPEVAARGGRVARLGKVNASVNRRR